MYCCGPHTPMTKQHIHRANRPFVDQREKGRKKEKPFPILLISQVPVPKTFPLPGKADRPVMLVSFGEAVKLLKLGPRVAD